MFGRVTRVQTNEAVTYRQPVRYIVNQQRLDSVGTHRFSGSQRNGREKGGGAVSSPKSSETRDQAFAPQRSQCELTRSATRGADETSQLNYSQPSRQGSACAVGVSQSGCQMSGSDRSLLPRRRKDDLIHKKRAKQRHIRHESHTQGRVSNRRSRLSASSRLPEKNSSGRGRDERCRQDESRGAHRNYEPPFAAQT